MDPFLSVLILLCAEFCFCLNCKAMSGDLVDWFMMYKVPKATREMSKKTTGKEFYYLDANNPTWSFKDVDIQKPDKNPLYYTLEQIYQKIPEEYGMYNDEPPQSPVLVNTESGAHMKGAFAFDKDSGFWLILSVPHFPAPQKQKYSYDIHQISKAQSILCISLDRKYRTEMEKIFNLTKPIFYDGSKPLLQKFTTKMNHHRNGPNGPIVTEFITSKGQSFRGYAKSASFGKDLYHSLVAKNLKDNLFVETWHPNLTTNCSMYKVYDVKEVSFEDKYWFKSTIDHAKWAVTEKKDWACIGDINRSMTQFKRGGGTMCIHHAVVAKQFRKIVKKKEECPR
uniref:Plancitoxin-1 n=2 Tax=Magallana gigas TaxID=29159 RepID=A0A8W8LDR0_MAGGI|nr:plancitoxin-1 isoform X1 [Crassostrea gigas]